jgi:hypothetical protein
LLYFYPESIFASIAGSDSCSGFGSDVATFKLKQKTANCLITEATMKTFLIMMEELWVAAAFAEADAYESLGIKMEHPQSRETACLRAA